MWAGGFEFELNANGVFHVVAVGRLLKSLPGYGFSGCRKVLYLVALDQNTNGKVFLKVLPFIYDGGARRFECLISVAGFHIGKSGLPANCFGFNSFRTICFVMSQNLHSG